MLEPGAQFSTWPVFKAPRGALPAPTPLDLTLLGYLSVAAAGRHLYVIIIKPLLVLFFRDKGSQARGRLVVIR